MTEGEGGVKKVQNMCDVIYECSLRQQSTTGKLDLSSIWSYTVFVFRSALFETSSIIKNPINIQFDNFRQTTHLNYILCIIYRLNV